MNNFGVPFSGIEKEINDLGVIATREDEAIAMAVGAWLAGETPTVYMQDSGLGNSLDIITSLLIPYGIDIDLLIGRRTAPKHHECMGFNSNTLLAVIGYETYRYTQ